MNRWWSNGPSDALEEANNKVLAMKFSAPDEPMVRGMKRQINCVNRHVQWRASAGSTG
jgi:hypothetical protein